MFSERRSMPQRYAMLYIHVLDSSDAGLWLLIASCAGLESYDAVQNFVVSK
jgi:hypothetical protein